MPFYSTVFYRSVIAVLCVIHLSCDKQPKGSQEKFSPNNEPESAFTIPIDDQIEKPYVYMGTFYQIRDYNRWYKSYNEFVKPKMKIGVLSSLQDSSYIAVFQLIPGIEEGEVMASSENFKRYIRDAGAVTEPEVTFYQIIEDPNEGPDHPYRIIVALDISENDTWQQAYHANRNRIEDHGMATIGLALDAQISGRAYLIFSSNKIEISKDYLESNAFNHLMNSIIGAEDVSITYWKLFAF